MKCFKFKLTISFLLLVLVLCMYKEPDNYTQIDLFDDFPSELCCSIDDFCNFEWDKLIILQDATGDSMCLEITSRIPNELKLTDRDGLMIFYNNGEISYLEKYFGSQMSRDTARAIFTKNKEILPNILVIGKENDGICMRINGNTYEYELTEINDYMK